MKTFLGFGLLCATVVVADRVVGRQTTPSSTTSVFAIPTPTSAQTVNGSDHDLSKKFCRIWRHQSTYADGKIYIDGGNIYIPDGNTTFNTMTGNNYEQGMNDVLLVLDLSSNFTNQQTTPYSVIDKGPSVPNALIEGALWYSQITRKIYQLGGWFSYNSVSDPGYLAESALPPSAIWEFDIDTQLWEMSSFSYVNTGNKVDRPGASANCDAPTLNQSFIFEGYVQQRSDIEYQNYSANNGEFKYLEGMLSLDTNTSPPTLTNISVPDYVGPRMNGAMIHVPVGPKGVIVQIAGQSTLNPQPFGVGIVGANGFNTNINNSFVDIYDIETGYWFRQATFGVPDIPTGRSDICTILVSAPDGTSYNIFMIAGVQTYNSVIAYEDMWVLTIPTFQWVKVHTRPGGIYGHTCHQVGENLIVVGGMQTTSSGGNAPNCSAHMPAEIFSLVEMEYTGIFDAAGAQRAPPVPADVVTLIGGTSTGGAVVTKPNLWSDLYLQYVFNPSVPRPSYTPTYQLANETASTPTNTSIPHTPTPTAAPSKTNIGAIAGGAVGGVIFLALLCILIWFLLKRRSSKKSHSAPQMAQAELPTYQESKDAVEVSGANHPLTFTPYTPFQRDPAELDAEQAHHSEEAQDEWRPMGVPRSPQMGSPGRFSEVSTASVVSGSGRGTPEQGVGYGRGTPDPGSGREGRRSRQSEVSRGST